MKRFYNKGITITIEKVIIRWVEKISDFPETLKTELK